MSVSVGLTSVRVQITALLPELTKDYNERYLDGGAVGSLGRGWGFSLKGLGPTRFRGRTDIYSIQIVLYVKFWGDF